MGEGRRCEGEGRRCEREGRRCEGEGRCEGKGECEGQKNTNTQMPAVQNTHAGVKLQEAKRPNKKHKSFLEVVLHAT